VLSVVFVAMTIALLVATIAAGRGRAWGALLIGLFGFGVLAWFVILSGYRGIGFTGPQPLAWICVIGGTAIEIAVAVGLAGRRRGAMRAALRATGLLVGTLATLLSALLTLLALAGPVMIT
jgi:hypothetical protein